MPTSPALKFLKQFMGAISHQYKQIGNAVPVNLAYAMGRSLVRLLNEIELKTQSLAAVLLKESCQPLKTCV